MSRLRDSTVIASVLDGRPPNNGYDSVTVRVVGDHLDLRIHVMREDSTFGLNIPGPRFSEIQPWIYAVPTDVSDWAAMLAIWLDENLTAGAAHLATEQRDGISYLIAASYGLRRADEVEHERLTRLEPHGGF